MLKWLMISCKEATYLVSKKEENKLTWLLKIKLRAHLAICSMCRRFEQQSGLIGRMAGKIHIHATLPPESKEKMQKILQDQ